MLSPMDYADLFTAAIEGGINYWAAVDNYRWQSAGVSALRFDEYPKPDPADDYAYATIIEEETGVETFVDSRSEVWHNAVAKAAEYRGLSVGAFFEDHDADSGDLAMQFAVLGEITYG